jgi:integrase
MARVQSDALDRFTLGQPHSRKRGATSQFRRVVPADLRARLGRSEIIRSLGRVAPSEARVLNHRLWSATETLFMSLRLNPGISREEVEAFSKRLLGDLLFDTERNLAGIVLNPRDEDNFPIVTYAEAYEVDAEEARVALARNDLSIGRRLLAKHFGDAAADLSDEDQRMLARAAMRTLVEADSLAARRVREEILPHLSPVAAYGGSAAASGQGAAPEAMTARSQRNASTLFSVLWSDYVANQIAIKAWTEPVARQCESSRRLFVAICGDKPMGDYGPLDGTTFRTMVLGLPTTYDKSPSYRDFYKSGDIVGLVAAAKAVGAETVKPKTFNRHFSALNPMWEWAIGVEALPPGAASIFANLFVAQKKRKEGGERASEQRPMWTTPHLATILSTPLFLGCRSRLFCRNPGENVFRDERYWGILLGVHTGMRREEIFQLRVKHVRRDEESGIWHVDLFSPGLRLKDSGSPRFVPLHANILELGFIEDRILERDPEAMVFPEAKASKADGKFGDLFGKWFGLWRRHYSVPDAMDFHSFRHTVETLLVRSGCTRAIAEEFIGHEDGDRRSEFSRYNKGATLEILKASIDKVAFPVDVAALNAAFARANKASGTTTAPDPA